MKKIGFAWILIFVLALGINSVNADPLEWSFNLYTDANISGSPGDTIGWGYQITNSDLQYWLLITGINDVTFTLGDGDAQVFDYPPISPGQLRQQPFDYNSLTGLYALILRAESGFESGDFVLTAEWWTEDPDKGGVFYVAAGTRSAKYSVTVTPVPEPTTILLLSTGLFALAGYGKRRKFQRLFT